MEIEKQLRTIICDELNLHKTELTSNATLSDLGADSLDQTEIVMRIEEEFGIEIPSEDRNRIQTVRSAANYIQQVRSEP